MLQVACSVNKKALYGNPWILEKIDKKGKLIPPKLKSAGVQQDSCLPALKASRPWYKRINADVLQMLVRQLNAAYDNFFKLGRGYPKFKRRSKFRSFSYKPGQVKIKGRSVRLPGIGWMVFYSSRPIPQGFSIRTVTIRRKSDGWYMAVRLENKTVPDLIPPSPSQVKKAIGADLGIKKLLSLSNRVSIANPRFSQQVERRRKILHRAASRKQFGSKNRRKAYIALGRLEQKVANCRTDYHWKKAKGLCRCADAIIFENLNVKGMMARCKRSQDEKGKYLKNGQTAKSGLNRSIADAAWGEFKLLVKVVAAKSGVIVHEVHPKHTSQQCSQCGNISSTNRNGENICCETCGYIEDADVQASINIGSLGLIELGIDPSKLLRVPQKVTPMEISLGLPDEPRNPVQLNLFDLEQWRSIR